MTFFERGLIVKADGTGRKGINPKTLLQSLIFTLRLMPKALSPTYRYPLEKRGMAECLTLKINVYIF